MNGRLAILGLVSMVVTMMAVPVHGYAQENQPPEQHDHQHPATAAPEAAAPPDQHGSMTDMMARMKATNQRLDELVARMNGATGAEKTDAMAQLLTALVQDRRAMCESMMSNMSTMMMHMMGGMGMREGETSSSPK